MQNDHRSLSLAQPLIKPLLVALMMLTPKQATVNTPTSRKFEFFQHKILMLYSNSILLPSSISELKTIIRCYIKNQFPRLFVGSAGREVRSRQANTGIGNILVSWELLTDDFRGASLKGFLMLMSSPKAVWNDQTKTIKVKWRAPWIIWQHYANLMIV